MAFHDLYYIQGLWILGAIFMMLGAVIAGNIEWVEGTAGWSFALSLVIAFVFFLIAGLCWISSAVNARKEER
ncbi:MAG: hypothetical protein HZB67_00595 [Candidatus Aenigmarchaeota archaeon]|nr:hypothetical protein [Candidatus Aenigmarchaeota archaeon]